MKLLELEIWADSFHEGDWCCQLLTDTLVNEYGASNLQVSYSMGFQPVYEVDIDGTRVSFRVFGSYRSWSKIPPKISELLSWGKPDFILYDPKANEVIFGVEETAATATGNQTMQRLERQYGSARFNVPYWYLVSEYGVHVDGGTRRDSIWPVVGAIKLTIQKKVPSVVVHYSDIDNLEDYSSGKGLKLLFQSLSKVVCNYAAGKDVLDSMEDLLAEQYKEMLSFLLDQWQAILEFLPSESVIRDKKTPRTIAKYAMGEDIEPEESLGNLLHWPVTKDVPRSVMAGMREGSLLKFDPLLALVEKDVGNKRAYTLSNNAGSGQPRNTRQMLGYIQEQKNKFRTMGLPDLQFSMRIEDFPYTNERRQNHHITTAKNIVYLYDKWEDFFNCLVKAYPRLASLKDRYASDKPVFLYVSNSLKSGRIFGDPFTGQIACYSIAFGKFDEESRIVVAYYPHQVHAQAFDSAGRLKRNKGITLLSEVSDLAIFHGGAAVSFASKEMF